MLIQKDLSMDIDLESVLYQIAPAVYQLLEFQYISAVERRTTIEYGNNPQPNVDYFADIYNNTAP